MKKNGTPIQSALDAERDARQAVQKAREQAAAIRRSARQRARQIARRAEERIKLLHNRVDASLAQRRRTIEHHGAEALKELRREAISDEVMNQVIDAMVGKIMALDERDHDDRNHE